MDEKNKPTIERLGSLTLIKKGNGDLLAQIKKPQSGGILLKFPQFQIGLSSAEAHAISSALFYE